MPPSAPQRASLAVLTQDIVLRLQQMGSAPPGRGDRAALPSHLAADREVGRLRSACRIGWIVYVVVLTQLVLPTSHLRSGFASERRLRRDDTTS